MDQVLVKDILINVKNLLNVQSRWTNFRDARDKDGWDISPNSPDAVCWCLRGAIKKCTYFPDDLNMSQILEEIAIQNNIVKERKSIVHINDNLGYATVMLLLDAAIKDQDRILV